MIGVDWGTSRVRAYRLRDDGAAGILDRCESADGVRGMAPERFASTLHTLVEPWLLAGERRILLSGMVGSRQGWREVQAVPCAVRLGDLVSALQPVPFPDACVQIVPGVTATDSARVPEIMRGEETQIIGAGLDAGLICLPGSHSKWAQVANGAIIGFATYLTGEAFATLGAHTMLAPLVGSSPPVAGPAFDAGVARASQPGGLLHHLFGVRTLGLTGQFAEREAASYLSGLIIGHEVREALMTSSEPVLILASASLGALYARAIGDRARLGDEDAAARGLALIGSRAIWPT